MSLCYNISMSSVSCPICNGQNRTRFRDGIIYCSTCGFINNTKYIIKWIRNPLFGKTVVVESATQGTQTDAIAHKDTGIQSELDWEHWGWEDDDADFRSGQSKSPSESGKDDEIALGILKSMLTRSLLKDI